jgi:hypothetical protein
MPPKGITTKRKKADFVSTSTANQKRTVAETEMAALGRAVDQVMGVRVLLWSTALTGMTGRTACSAVAVSLPSGVAVSGAEDSDSEVATRICGAPHWPQKSVLAGTEALQR